jgi:hypothetical protein
MSSSVWWRCCNSLRHVLASRATRTSRNTAERNDDRSEWPFSRRPRVHTATPPIDRTQNHRDNERRPQQPRHVQSDDECDHQHESDDFRVPQHRRPITPIVQATRRWGSLAIESGAAALDQTQTHVGRCHPSCCASRTSGHRATNRRVCGRGSSRKLAPGTPKVRCTGASSNPPVASRCWCMAELLLDGDEWKNRAILIGAEPREAGAAAPIRTKNQSPLRRGRKSPD